MYIYNTKLFIRNLAVVLRCDKLSLDVKMCTASITLSLLFVIVAVHGAEPKFHGTYRPNTGEPGGVIVHLMDWKYKDIAQECQTVLSKGGFAGVQVSPVTEYLMVVNSWELFAKLLRSRPWYPRHQVVSYQINTPSGNEEDFKDMVHKCNTAGIKVYVDVVLNHMTGGYPNDNVGCAGSEVDTVNFKYPGVPYSSEDFNQPKCAVDEKDPKLMRNCEFRELHDLNQTNPCVRAKMRAFLNKLISFGVAGFRVGQAKYMWPEDLQKIFGQLDYLNCDEGFACDTPPYVYLDYFDTDAKSSVKATEYYPIGRVVDHRYAQRINNIFYHNEKPIDFGTIKEAWQLLDSEKSVVFVDTYETQRETSNPIWFETFKIYKLAVALLLASPHGQPLITSSYRSKKGDPPYTTEGVKCLGIRVKSSPGWICEHRSEYVVSMVRFRYYAGDAPITHWWHDGRYRFAFCRSKRGFILINNNPLNIENEKFKTDLPKGIYCNVIAGDISNGECPRGTVKVDGEGYAHVAMLESSDRGEGVLAIHIGAVMM